MVDGNLPNGWVRTTLGDLFTWGSGGTPLKDKSEYYGGNIPWVIIGDLNDDIVIETSSSITEAGLKNSSAKWVDAGSVLIAMYGSIGKLGIAGRRLTTNQAIAFTKADPVNQKFLFYYLMGERNRLNSKGSGVAQINISQTILKAYPFPLAPLAEQGRIVAKIEELFTQLDAGTAALERIEVGLQRYKASLLKTAVEGRLVEQNPDDQPAKLLLEKLAEQRKQRILSEKKQSFRLYIDLRVQNADVDYAPSDVLKDFLIEAVLEDMDIHAAQAVMNEYFSSVHSIIDNSTHTKQYVSWLANACGALGQLGHESKVINANLLAWQKHIDEGLGSQQANRVIKLKKGAGDSILTGFEKWLEVEKIRSAGIDDFRKRYLDEPVEIEWKKEMARLKVPHAKDLPELPQGWCWTTIEHLAKDEKYALAIGPFGSNLKVSDYRDEGVPLIFVRHIRSGDFNNTHYVTEEKADELNAHKVSGGDILITKMGEPPGDAYLYPETSPDAIITADCIKWRLFPILEKRFFVHLINSPMMQRQIQQITRGVAQKKVSLDRFRSLLVPLPPLKEQRRIVAEVDRRLSLAAATESTLAVVITRAERLRQSILKLAFEGKLVPQDPQEEPASKLLERILQNKKDEIKVSLRPRLIQTERTVRSRKQLPLPLPSSESLQLHEILRSSGRVLSPGELFVLAKCKPDDVSRFYEELRREIHELERIIELRPDRTKEGTLEARQ